MYRINIQLITGNFKVYSTVEIFFNMSDRRRLLGPVNTIIPGIGISSNPEDNIKVNSEESDRANDEIRKFFLKTGIIQNANGSAYLEVGNTIIEVLVFGPRPIKGSFIDRASFSVECKFLPHIIQPNEETFNKSIDTDINTDNTAGGNSRSDTTDIEHRISSYIETALVPSIILEKYPKSTIDLYISVISTEQSENESSKTSMLNLINWIVNCSSMALVNSEVELRDMVTSGHVKLVKDEIIFDPTPESKDGVEAVMSFMNLLDNQIVGFWVEGESGDEDDYKKLMEGCSTVSKDIRANLSSYLLKNI